MAMDRRTLVKYLAGASAAGALAGCISTEEPDDDGADDDGAADDGTDDADHEDDEDWPTVEPDDDVTGSAEIWHSLSDGELEDFDRYVDEFNDSFEATISADEVAELEESTETAIPAGDGPEMFVWAHDWIGRYHENGFLSDQSDNLNIDPQEYFGENAESATFEGETLGLPFAAETVALIVNHDYVDDQPEDFDEILEIADEVHDPADNTYGFCWPQDAYHVSAMPYGFGGYYYDDDSGELGLTNDETIAGFEFILEELWDYMPADPDGEAQESIFLEGNSPFLVTGPWNLGNFGDMDVSVMALPDANGNTPSPFTGVQLMYFAAAMDEDDERAEAAVAYAEWYTTNTGLISQMADDHGFIPVHVAFADDEEEADDLPEDMQGFADSVENGQPMPTAPDFGDVWEPLETEWSEALNGNKSVEDAMADAESQIQSAWE